MQTIIAAAITRGNQSGVVSILTSIAGLPEVKEDNNNATD